jgi:hypothetical protein
MAREIESNRLEQIKSHAVSRLTAAKAQQTNLSVLRRVFEQGEEFGPPTQRIIATEPTLVVFADDDPLANWGHACRYLLYNADSGELRQEIQARLPVGGLESFYKPVVLPRGPIEIGPFWPPRRPRCPIILPDGNRYAILFAGFAMERHLNDLEFCYRTLVNRYAVPPQNIFALSFNGTLTVVNDDWSGSSPAPAHWPGDNTPYQIHITGQGTLAGLENAFAQLAAKMGPKDLLFIHTNNHGDTDSSGSYIGYPAAFPGGSGVDWSAQWVNLYASTFGSMLGTLPAYRELLVMMEQCGSGGFGPDIMASTTATSTSFQAACLAGASSYAATYLGAPWDGFAYQWIAAMAGEYPNGSPLVSNPDTDGSPSVDALDAYNYAHANGLSQDSPNMSTKGPNADRIVLAEEYTFFGIWCWIFQSFLEPYYEAVLARKLSTSEFYRKLNKAVPALQKAILSESDNSLFELRRKLGPEIKRSLEASFTD